MENEEASGRTTLVPSFTIAVIIIIDFSLFIVFCFWRRKREGEELTEIETNGISRIKHKMVKEKAGVMMNAKINVFGTHPYISTYIFMYI